MENKFCKAAAGDYGDRRVGLGTFYQDALIANPLSVFWNFTFAVWVDYVT